MAESETAVLDPEDTADATEEQELDAPENTEGQDDAENGEGEKEPTESEDEEDEPSLTKAEVEKLLKAREASVRESERQKAEHKAQADAYTQKVSQAATVRKSAAIAHLNETAATVAQVLESGQKVNPQWLQQRHTALAEALDGMAFTEQYDAIYGEFRGYLKANDLKLPGDVEEGLLAANRALRPDAMFGSLMKAMEAAALEKLTPAVKKTVTEEMAKAKTTAGLKSSAERRSPAPTTGLGTGNGRTLTLAQIEAMPSSEWHAIGANEKDGGRATRSAILARAHEQTRKAG
ncbi:MAG: hypothetical protein KGL39_54610 [Patescibacteria group bacterium]|nr:hypothetical protein [Patescibacteria group bacterium]